MKAFSALRSLACASLFSLVGVTTSSAQLFFHVVDKDSINVDSNSNLGVAVDIQFLFSAVSGSPGAQLGTLTINVWNLSGTQSQEAPPGTLYTTGQLWGFGFDLPGSVGSPETPVMNYKAGTFTNFFNNDPDGVVNFIPDFPYTEPNPQGTFDFGAVTWSPQPQLKSLNGGAMATFTMQFEGDLTNFNPGGFFSHNGADSDFGFRFQAVGANGGSDKFVYYDNPPIPEPSTYGLVAASLLVGLVMTKRVRSRKSLAS